MHLVSETILEKYYHNDDARNNHFLIRKKKKRRGKKGCNQKGEGDKNHKFIWFLSCFRQQPLHLTDYSAESVEGGGVGRGEGGRRGDYYLSKLNSLAMEDDGSFSSSCTPSTTASTTATTTTASTRMPSPEGSRGKPKKGLKRFPRVLKAILFETALAKKIRKRKNTQKEGGNIYVRTTGNVDPTKLSSEQDPSIPNQNGVVKLTPVLLNSSTVSSLAGSMSSSSATTALSNSTFTSSSSNSNNSSTNSRSSTGNNAALPLVADAAEIILLQQQQQEQLQQDVKGGTIVAAAGKGRYSSNVGLCLILVSLVVLVFWGKVCAIIFTSTWLFFVPHCIPGGTGSLSRIGAYYRKIEPEEYKKKVVMEGFLDRNIRNRARRWVGGLRGKGSRNPGE